MFVLNQACVFVSGAYIHNTHKHDFLHKKIISEEKIIISTLDKYCAFIIVNFILYFNKCTNRLRADSLSLNCILVVREKTVIGCVISAKLVLGLCYLSTLHVYK